MPDYSEQEDRIAKTCDQFLRLAEEKVKKENLEGRVKRLAKLYDTARKGDSSSIGEIDGDTMIRVNKIFPRVRVFVSSLYAKRPTVFARPSRLQDVDASKKSELFLNYWSRHTKASREIRMCLTHSGLFHYGCMKLGMDDGKNALPWIEAVHPMSVRVDPTLETFEPHRGKWVAFRYYRTFSDMRRNKLYDEKEIDELWGEYSHKSDSGGDDEETCGLWLWEHYFQKDKRIHVVVKPFEYDCVLRNNDNFTTVVGLPARFLSFSPSFNGFFPMSVAEQMIDQQKEINKLRSQQSIHAERSNSFYAYDKNKIDVEDLPALESEEAKKYVPVNGPPNGVIASVDQPNLTSDVYNVEARVEGDMMEMFGVGSAQTGGQDMSPSKSATEASIIENNLRMRANDYQEVFEEWLEGVYQGVLNLAQERLSGDLQIKITDGLWVPLSRDDIKGDVDVSLSFGSTLPTDRQAEWEKAKELFGIFQNNPLVDQLKLTRFVLNAQGDIKEASDWIVPPPPPQAPPGLPMGMEQPGMMPGMDGAMPPPPDMTGGAPMMGDPAAQANMMAMEGVQNGASPLEMAGDYRNIASFGG